MQKANAAKKLMPRDIKVERRSPEQQLVVQDNSMRNKSTENEETRQS